MTPKRGKNGGARPGAGRKPRGPGKVKYDLKVAAQEYSATALETLVGIMQDGEGDPADRIRAAQAIWDRGHGKAVQAHEGTGEDGVINIRIVD